MEQYTARAAAFPAKRFFVEMLTRDIELTDAILDLLDNCVDGAMRRRAAAGSKVDAERPYQDCWAHIEFSESGFSIEDNCGGIPIEIAKWSAFRMGRADPTLDIDLPTVGVYGIGMKRALFKLGAHCVVESQTTEGSFSLTITPEWMESDTEWELDLIVGAGQLSTPGTRITVTYLRDGIAQMLATENLTYRDELDKAISAYYGYIIEKGFEVVVNTRSIEPQRVSLLVDQSALEGTRSGIAPYVYETEIDGVSVSLTVGMYRDLPTNEEDEAANQGKPSTERAGWTVICNDRVVLHADKTRMTGWGEAGVPAYHTQFVSISGVIEFRSASAAKLPITTTKRGIDGNSDLYLSVKEFMREGLKTFTDYTNRWKQKTPAREEVVQNAKPVLAGNASEMIPTAKWSRVNKPAGGRKYRPSLPMPTESDPLKWMRFAKKTSDIELVASYLFDDKNFEPSVVAEKCFSDVLRKLIA